MPSVSPQDQVLALPELVVAIIGYLPIRDILISAQRVKRSWKAAVDSVPLQRALFFAALPSDSGFKSEFNPLLREKFPGWFKPSEKKGYGRGERGWKFQELEWGSSEERCAAYKRKDASWRRMLPVQPPATVFQVCQTSNYQTGSELKVGQTTFQDGVRMGTIYDWAQKTVAEPISDFQMKWQMAHPSEDDEFSFGMSVPVKETPDEPERRENGHGLPKVTMHTTYTMQCVIDLESDIGLEFVSEGFQALELSWGETKDIEW